MSAFRITSTQANSTLLYSTLDPHPRASHFPLHLPPSAHHCKFCSLNATAPLGFAEAVSRFGIAPAPYSKQPHVTFAAKRLTYAPSVHVSFQPIKTLIPLYWFRKWGFFTSFLLFHPRAPALPPVRHHPSATATEGVIQGIFHTITPVFSLLSTLKSKSGAIPLRNAFPFRHLQGPAGDLNLTPPCLLVHRYIPLYLDTPPLLSVFAIVR